MTFQFELPNGYTTEAVGVFERWDAEAETYFAARRTAPRCASRPVAVRHGKVIPDRPAATQRR